MKGFFKGFQKGFHSFGMNITTIVNTILLLLVYIVGIGLTSIVAKLVGKRFLELRLSKEAGSYWSDLNLKRRPIEEHYKQH